MEWYAFEAIKEATVRIRWTRVGDTGSPSQIETLTLFGVHKDLSGKIGRFRFRKGFLF